jgi:hypothetical protein
MEITMRLTHNLSLSVTSDNSLLDVAVERNARSEASNLFMEHTHRHYALGPNTQINVAHDLGDILAMYVRTTKQIKFTLDGTGPNPTDETYRAASVLSLTPPAVAGGATGATNDAVFFVAGGLVCLDLTIFNPSATETAEVEVFYGTGAVV